MNIGERMKRYEFPHNILLTPRTPVIVRIDGRAFHTYTKNMNRPFDEDLINAMIVAAEKTAKEMQGFKLCYIQSDEASFLLTDFDSFDTEPWFNYELNKLVSITASAFTAYFNQYMGVDQVAMFDARAFNIPMEDIPNYFIWRQRDWERNSLQMLSRTYFSHKELEKKKTNDMHEMLHKKGVNWAKLEDKYKNGTFIFEDYTKVYKRMNYDDIYDLVIEPLKENL